LAYADWNCWVPGGLNARESVAPVSELR